MSNSALDDHLFSIDLWEKNASHWIRFTSEGKDLYRDHICTPGFFSILPDIAHKKGLDIACGDGHFTRLLASKNACMTAIDLCSNFIEHAKEKEKSHPQEISYLIANALTLPFDNSTFDFATCFFSLIDISDYQQAIKEAYRTLKPGGFFQFVIPHPCTWTPQLEWVLDANNKKKAAICGGYFTSSTGTLNEWTFEGMDWEQTKVDGQIFKSIYFRRKLSEWIDALVATNFTIEKIGEPKCESTELLDQFPMLEGANIVPIYLIIRCRKAE